MMNPEQINVTVSNSNVIINKLKWRNRSHAEKRRAKNRREVALAGGIWNPERRNDTQKCREVTA